jgi:endoglucanase
MPIKKKTAKKSVSVKASPAKTAKRKRSVKAPVRAKAKTRVKRKWSLFGRRRLDNRGRLQLRWTKNKLRLAMFITLFAVIGVVALLLTRAAPVRPTGKIVPTDGIYLGAFSTGGNWPGDEIYKDRFVAREAKIGRKFDINHRFYGWANTFGGGLEKWDVDNGRVPMATWKPEVSGEQQINAINSGSQDSKIAHQADLIKQLGKPIFIRFGHEMNNDTSPWNAKFTSDPGTHNGTTKYINAWKRIHNIFVSHGATNAVWVWEPGATDIPNESWNHWTNYYPGDSYVDWVGIDGYNWGTARPYGGWISFKDRFKGGVYAEYSSKKPIMICETASTEEGGDKAQWIRDMQVSVKADFPAVGALVWFDENKETDWRFDSSTASLSAFKAAGADPYFHPSFGTTTPPPPPPAPSPTPTPPPAPGTADLIVTNITWSPSTPAPNQSVTFSATIKNQGTGSTPAGTVNGVAFYVNGQKVTWSDNNNSSITPGTSVTVTANSGPTGSKTWSGGLGTYTVEAYVDDINRIPESNEGNNKRSESLSIKQGTGWTGSYYNGTTLSTLKLTRTDPTIDFSWSGSPVSGVNTDMFSVRWKGDLHVPATGTYTFTARTDDGVRLWVNNQRIIDDWSNHAAQDTTGSIALTGGRTYPVTMEYYDNVSGAMARLSWSGPGIAKTIVPTANVYPR